TRRDVWNLFDKIESHSTANAVLAHTSAAFKWMVKREIVPTNPCIDVESHKMDPRQRCLSDTELRELLLALKREGTVQARALTAAVFLGQRPGEIANWRREHIVDGGAWWEVPGKPVPALGWPGVKNGDTHDVFLPQPVREIIGDGATGFVFTSANGR